MRTFAPDTTLVDLEYLGYREAIATCLLESDGNLALVDPGPASALAMLKAKLAQRGLSVGDLAALLLTHIHLDHAGASGVLVRENPRLRVYVHERGAPHLIDPAKLLASAARLYGDQMERLWGEVAPVPAVNITTLVGGESIRIGARTIEVLYTPGHAWHHATYFDTATGTAFVGDTGGLRRSGRACVLPLTPPPDIDLQAWAGSLAAIRARQPRQLFLTHFGPGEDPEAHLAQLEQRLTQWSDRVRRSMADGGPHEVLAAQFAQEVSSELASELPEADLRWYAKGAALEQCWQGLARYWRKRLSG